jgi:hypothetical protein
MEESLPYVAAAFFCERLIEGKDGVFSVIRIVDRAQVEVGSNDPSLLQVLQERNILPIWPTTIFLSIKAGPATGKANIEIIAQRPSGKRTSLHSFPIELKGADQGANFVLNMNVSISEEGLHWFDIMFNDSLLTRIPLTIVRTPAPAKNAAMAEKSAD